MLGLALLLLLMLLLLLIHQALRDSARPSAGVASISRLSPLLFLVHSLTLVAFLVLLGDFDGELLVGLMQKLLLALELHLLRDSYRLGSLCNWSLW